MRRWNLSITRQITYIVICLVIDRFHLLMNSTIFYLDAHKIFIFNSVYMLFFQFNSLWTYNLFCFRIFNILSNLLAGKMLPHIPEIFLFYNSYLFFEVPL